jgi:mono/diheme cytochrome c family protein
MTKWVGGVALLACLASSGTRAETPIERGGYLVNTIMTCQNCHTPRGPNGLDFDKQLSGGLTFDEPPFKVMASNITPDRETGIGAWTDAEIKKVLLTGVRPNGVSLAPVMPTAYYTILTPGDLDAIVAYLRSIKPVKSQSPSPIYKIALPAEQVPNAGKPMREADLADKVKRGTYLATIGHCLECHTPLGPAGHDFKAGLGKGGQKFKGPWGQTVSRNITSHPKSGLGSWTDAEIKRAITEGVSRDGSPLKPPMGYAFYAKMTPDDLDAVIAWVRTLPALE